MKNPIHVRFHRVPIYELRLWIGVADCVDHLFTRFKWAFAEEGSDQSACVAYAGDKTAIFFDRPEISHEAIAHEVFHATHRMLDHCSHRLHSDTHEPHAYLCGYVTQLVYEDMARFGIKVAAKSRVVPERYVRKPALKPA